MSTITAASIITKAQIVLQDTAGERWSDTELLDWLNDGQREVVLYKPNSCVKNIAVKLAEGTKQSLPPDAVQLMDVPRNMGVNGSTPGRAIRIAMRETLDSQAPNWHFSTPSPAVKHFMYSMLDPKTFYVYPPQPASNQGYVELIYGASPGDATLSSVISLDDIYQSILLDYTLFRAYLKDTEFAADPGRAGTHQAAYMSALSGKAKVEIGVNPNSTAPANPNMNRAG